MPTFGTEPHLITRYWTGTSLHCCLINGCRHPPLPSSIDAAAATKQRSSMLFTAASPTTSGARDVQLKPFRGRPFSVCTGGGGEEAVEIWEIEKQNRRKRILQRYGQKRRTWSPVAYGRTSWEKAVCSRLELEQNWKEVMNMNRPLVVAFSRNPAHCPVMGSLLVSFLPYLDSRLPSCILMIKEQCR